MRHLTFMVVPVALVTLMVGCQSSVNLKNYYSAAERTSVIPASREATKRIELDQAWNDQTRMAFWFTSQGSRIIPYSWFTWLEQADNEEYFRSADHMESLRYLPLGPSSENPAGLPIGFARDLDKKTGQDWVGLTCAACHTNQLDYKGKKILIEGAPTLANFVLFYSKLLDALNATNKNQEKFDRFAHKVLAGDYSPEKAIDLRAKLLQVTLRVGERQAVNSLPSNYPDDFTSYARLDAFGNIQNAGSAFALHDLNNKNAPTAPVSYPFLWGTHQSDVVQWNASAPNTPVVGPLVRNVGEVVGVFGNLSMEKAPWWQRIFCKNICYSSTVDMIGLGQLETWIKTLRSPAWPQNILPPIDGEIAARGNLLFEQHCGQCHKVIPRADEGKKYISTKTPLSVVGTDPAMAWNADYHMAKTLILEGTKEKILAGEKFGKTAPSIKIAVNGVVGIVLKNPFKALEAGLMPGRAGNNLKSVSPEETKTLEEYLEIHSNKRIEMQKNKNLDFSPSGLRSSKDNLEGLVYKARPLNGIWATAPYLHNGSVSSLWELLQKPEKRETGFWVGSREFDPKKVGYVTTEGLSKFNVLDKTGNIQAGNSNRGHDYGTALSDEQKWELIEYMKTLGTPNPLTN